MPIHFRLLPEVDHDSLLYSHAKALHWLMAILFFGLLALGFYMHDLPLSPEKLQLYSWHKWAGVTAFLLIWLRPRVASHAPSASAAGEHVADVQLAAHAGHLVLYVLMIAIPLSGWLMSSAKGFQTVWFGVLPIPDLLGKNKELGDLLANHAHGPQPDIRRRHRGPHRCRAEAPLHRQGRHPDPHVAQAKSRGELT
jgi:cytochrome b561